MVYGAAKAGFTDILSGLRNRLARSGVHVVTVKPGFVRTRMTDGMDLPERLTAGPDGLLRWLSRPFPSAAMCVRVEVRRFTSLVLRATRNVFSNG